MTQKTHNNNGGPAALLTMGMSLRDWFAGQALAGIMANPERWRDIQRRYDKGKMAFDDASDSNAVKAYNIADAMLAARDAPPTYGASVEGEK